jgi:CelD/BcsL family acetyltransferase involved in cellulose biosynthesis
MRLEVVDKYSRLEQIGREWPVFAQRIRRLTPFQLPAWLLTWWRHFGGGELRVFLFRDEDAIAAVIPCFLHQWNGRKQLTLIGSGISDYLEPAIAPERQAEVIDCLRRYLIETDDWDICDWQDLDGTTPLSALAGLQEDTPCTEIELTGAFEKYWAKRGKDLRRNLRRYGERADKMGPSEFSVTNDSALIEELIRLHGIRWQKQGEAGMITANNSAEFLRDITRQFEHLDMLRFLSVRFRGEVVAISVGFLYEWRFYSYLSAFDPAYEILGFGRRLLHDALRYAYEQRYKAWNFCRGEEPYKFSFGAERIGKRRLVFTPADLDTT